MLRLFCFFVQVTPAGECKLKWIDPDEAGLLKFLVEGKGCVVQPRARQHFVFVVWLFRWHQLFVESCGAIKASASF